MSSIINLKKLEMGEKIMKPQWEDQESNNER